jgi:hypothetical protein
LIKCLFSQKCNAIKIATPDKQFTMKGISELLENTRNNASISVYKIEEEADANSFSLTPQLPFNKLSAIVKCMKVSSKGYMKTPCV